jgi:uncharacterized small protein (DUF1192 family)
MGSGRGKASDMDLAEPMGQAAQCAHTRHAWRKIMNFDDELPVPRPARLTKLALDRLSISELREYIDELKAEIVRVEADIDKKGRSRDAAEAFFKR